jgi:hypothetical protein
MSTAFFDSSGGNPPIYIDSPTTGEEAPMANRSPSDSFFGNASNNNSVNLKYIYFQNYLLITSDVSRILFLLDKMLSIISG